MDGRPIPGFYFDPEKKKYFAIQANHEATQYTHDYVKEEQQKAKRQKLAAQAFQKQTRQRVRRSHFFTRSTACGMTIRDELGDGGRSPHRVQSERARVFLNGLSPKEQLSTLGFANARFSGGLEALEYDDMSDCAIVAYRGHTGNRMITWELSNERYLDRNTERLRKLPRHPRLSQILRSQVASLNLSPSRVLVATTYGFDEPPDIAFTSFHQISPDDIASGIPVVEESLIVTLHPTDSTLFASACCEARSPANAGEAVFAVGASEAALILATQDGDPNITERLETKHAVLSVDWQSPHVLGGGLRNSEVRLWDLRSEGSVARIRAEAPLDFYPRKSTKAKPQAIDGLKWVQNGQQVIVRGTNNYLALYDLRMIRQNEDPVVYYPFRGNTIHSTQNLPLAVHERLGLLSVADWEGKVQNFDVPTGRELRTLRDVKGDCKGLKWIERDGRDVLKGAFHDCLVDFAW